jgi:PAS domain S-box-containing protein
MLLLDAECRVTYMTASSQRHLGWTPPDVVGRSIFEFLHADDRETITARIAEALQTPTTTVTAEVRFRHPDDSDRTMEIVVVNRPDRRFGSRDRDQGDRHHRQAPAGRAPPPGAENGGGRRARRRRRSRLQQPPHRRSSATAT